MAEDKENMDQLQSEIDELKKKLENMGDSKTEDTPEEETSDEPEAKEEPVAEEAKDEEPAAEVKVDEEDFDTSDLELDDEEEKEEKKDEEEPSGDDLTAKLLSISRVDVIMAKRIIASGIDTEKKLKTATVDDLLKVQGIGATQAQTIVDSVKQGLMTVEIETTDGVKIISEDRPDIGETIEDDEPTAEPEKEEAETDAPTLVGEPAAEKDEKEVKFKVVDGEEEEAPAETPEPEELEKKEEEPAAEEKPEEGSTDVDVCCPVDGEATSTAEERKEPSEEEDKEPPALVSKIKGIFGKLKKPKDEAEVENTEEPKEEVVEAKDEAEPEEPTPEEPEEEVKAVAPAKKEVDVKFKPAEPLEEEEQPMPEVEEVTTSTDVEGPKEEEAPAEDEDKEPPALVSKIKGIFGKLKKPKDEEATVESEAEGPETPAEAPAPTPEDPFAPLVGIVEPEQVQLLKDAGYTSSDELKDAIMEDLELIDGIDEETASKILVAVK